MGLETFGALISKHQEMKAFIEKKGLETIEPHLREHTVGHITTEELVQRTLSTVSIMIATAITYAEAHRHD